MTKKPVHFISCFNCFFCFVAVLLFFSTVSIRAEEPAVYFKAQPPEISIGDSVVLSWDVTPIPGSPRVFITGIGGVSPGGQLNIKPEKKNTVYYLLCETDTKLKILRADIKVKGGRGDDDVFPQARDFNHSRTYQLQAPSKVKLLDGFHALLQDKMGFQVEESYHRTQDIWVFVTKPLMRTDLGNTDGGRIPFRRLAYRVVLSPPGTRGANSQSNVFTCRVETYIQYRRRKERTWRLETADTLHRECADTLRDGIKTII